VNLELLLLWCSPMKRICVYYQRHEDAVYSTLNHARYAQILILSNHHLSLPSQKSHNVPKACNPSFRHPCIISSLPCALLVINTTSAPNRVHVSLSNAIVSGRPPRFLESHRIMRSGSMCLCISPVMVGPKVRSWSDPIQIRNQSGDWMHVESAAPMPVPVQMRIPRLNMDDA
jgi:hypothetical protein